MAAPSSRPVHPHFEHLDCSPFTSIVVISSDNGGAHGSNGKVWSPFLRANMVSEQPYEPPGYVASLLTDWDIWSINHRIDPEKDTLTFRQPFPLAVSESLNRLKALYYDKMGRPLGVNPLLHMAVAYGAIMLYRNPAIIAFDMVRARWDARCEEACIGTPQEELLRTILEVPTPLKLTAPSSSLQRGGKADRTIYIRPELRQVINTLKEWTGMDYTDIALLCAAPYLASQAETPRTYREEMRNAVEKWVQLISYKARVADNAIAMYHSDIRVAWRPCDFTGLEYTPHLELLDTLRALHSPQARKEERAEQEVM